MRATFRSLAWLSLACICLLLISFAAATAQQTPGTQSATKQSSTPASGQASATQAGNMPSAAEIASAKASGKVWVNLDTRIYHRGGRWYGKTKHGKFMSESEAKAAGYRKSKRN